MNPARRDNYPVVHHIPPYSYITAPGGRRVLSWDGIGVVALGHESPPTEIKDHYTGRRDPEAGHLVVEPTSMVYRANAHGVQIAEATIWTPDYKVLLDAINGPRIVEPDPRQTSNIARKKPSTQELTGILNAVKSLGAVYFTRVAQDYSKEGDGSARLARVEQPVAVSEQVETMLLKYLPR
ncbi:hypothetical protein HYY71_06825 [Candidatus Woesearchaeota archaeon]|nr:hypothetical protein [Candidatus Woesearchaeota archaeon]